MILRFATLAVFTLSVCLAADTIAVLPLFNKDQEKSRNLDWIGEALSETLRESLGSNKLLVITREDREEVYRRMSVRAEAVLFHLLQRHLVVRPLFQRGGNEIAGAIVTN